MRLTLNTQWHCPLVQTSLAAWNSSQYLRSLQIPFTEFNCNRQLLRMVVYMRLELISNCRHGITVLKLTVFVTWRFHELFQLAVTNHSATSFDNNPLQPSGHCMYRQFNIQHLYVLPTQCIYVFCVDLRTNRDYFTWHILYQLHISNHPHYYILQLHVTPPVIFFHTARW